MQRLARCLSRYRESLREVAVGTPEILGPVRDVERSAALWIRADFAYVVIARWARAGSVGEWHDALLNSAWTSCVVANLDSIYRCVALSMGCAGHAFRGYDLFSRHGVPFPSLPQPGLGKCNRRELGSPCEITIA